MSSHLPSFFKSSKKQQQQQQQQLQQQQQQLAAQQQEALAQAQAKSAFVQPARSSPPVSPVRPTYGHQHTSSTGSATTRTEYSQPNGARGQETFGGVRGYQPPANPGYPVDRAPVHNTITPPPANGSKSSSQDSGNSGASGPPTHTPPAKHSGGVDSTASGSSVSSSVAGLPLQARTLSTYLGAGQSQHPQVNKMLPHQPQHQQQQLHQQYSQQGGYNGYGQPQMTERQQVSAVNELDAVSLSGIPIAKQQPQGQHQQYHHAQQQPPQQDTRMMSVDMADVSALSLNSPQPLHLGKQMQSGQHLSPVPAYGAQPQRSGSADEDRAREKLREAQEQAAQAQAALQFASQQARVATINAVATQAALASVTGAAAAAPAKPEPRKTAGRYALSDFGIERTLGTGSFGRVHLVRSKHNGRFYAVKVLGKEKVVRMKQVEHTNSEREMLVKVRHPFLVNLWGTFHDVNNLYMVMDFVAGGELFSLLRKSQRFPNSVAKFYAAEVALALDYLHSLDIIYRDLKPENLLLGADGHIKVTDFGFAKYVPDITWTLCGTPDYLAPEVVQSKGYNKSVDWYALGVLIFEMLAGYPPFFTEDGNPMKLYEKIIAGKVRYPAYFEPSARELLTHLLTGDLTKRYGNLRGGSADIFTHAWFAEVDWDKLFKREIPAPYVPKIEGDGDASQFDRYQEADVSEYGRTGRGPHDHLFPDF